MTWTRGKSEPPNSEAPLETWRQTCTLPAVPHQHDTKAPHNSTKNEHEHKKMRDGEDSISRMARDDRYHRFPRTPGEHNKEGNNTNPKSRVPKVTSIFKHFCNVY